MKSPASGDLTMACCRTYPSCTGTALVWVAPESITRPVDLPFANAVSTAFLQRKKAGMLYFSNISSVSFSRFGRTFHWIEKINKNNLVREQSWLPSIWIKKTSLTILFKTTNQFSLAIRTKRILWQWSHNTNWIIDVDVSSGSVWPEINLLTF